MQSALAQSRRLVLPELTGRAARSHPDRPAVIFGDDVRTHAELHDRAARLASVLATDGVGARDRVALLLHNRIEFVEALLACHHLGAVAVPINFRLAPDEVEYVLSDSGAVALITDAGSRVAGEGAIPMVLDVGPDYDDAVAGAMPCARAEAREDDPALMCYTSGTTGRPKGAVLTHRNLAASTLSWIHEMRAGEDDVWLSGQPLFHIGGINGLLPFLVLGATEVITPTTAFDPEAMLRLIEAHGVTMCIFVPTQWAAICASDAVARIDPRQLRVAMWGASSSPRHTLEAMEAAFPHAAIVSAYGQTEMSGATTLLKGPDSTRKMGSVGKPMLGVELRVVDDRFSDVATGAVGEIVYRGPNVMAGYHEQPDANREAFAGDWFHSGDLARLDDEGYLWLVDRKKDLIISGGENVYPAEVERVLLDHPAVAEVAVIGVPHPRWVETPVAFVVARESGEAREAGDPGLSKDELIAHCRRHLAGYKKPSAIVVVPALPRNAGGKVLKRRLRETYGDQFTATVE
ncbi:MAG TPA: long-chain fatty acid--CoA ligase [Solirubrobacteraceae bacterium]|nr:long-chain fatty acid--CoA ligase [Solirubrobacteraceae bacterium]